MNIIKYRQAIYLKGKFNSFNYWGFINNAFIGPTTGNNISIQDALKNSQQFSTLIDMHKKEIYPGDIILFNTWKPKEVIYADIGIPCYQLKHTDLWLTTYEQNKYEIIGNIYQNFELLREI